MVPSTPATCREQGAPGCNLRAATRLVAVGCCPPGNVQVRVDSPFTTHLQQTPTRTLHPTPARPKPQVAAHLNRTELAGLQALCGRCLYHSLYKVVIGHHFGSRVFVATGDIAEMWLRDSSVQLGGLLPRIAAHPGFRGLVEGAIRVQAFFITQVRVGVGGWLAMCMRTRGGVRASERVGREGGREGRGGRGGSGVVSGPTGRHNRVDGAAHEPPAGHQGGRARGV